MSKKKQHLKLVAKQTDDKSLSEYSDVFDGHWFDHRNKYYVVDEEKPTTYPVAYMGLAIGFGILFAVEWFLA